MQHPEDRLCGCAGHQVTLYLGAGVPEQGTGLRLDGLALLEIAVEAIAAKNEVGGHRQIGDGEQGNGPGDCPLCRADIQCGLDRRRQGQGIEKGGSDCEQLRGILKLAHRLLALGPFRQGALRRLDFAIGGRYELNNGDDRQEQRHGDYP